MTLSHRLKEDRLDGKEKFVTIFKRTGKNRPLEVYREKFSRKALAVFSESFKKQLDKSGAALLVISEAGGNMLPYDLILNWIDLCIDEGNDIKFPEVSAAVPSILGSTSNLFHDRTDSNIVNGHFGF